MTLLIEDALAVFVGQLDRIQAVRTLGDKRAGLECGRVLGEPVLRDELVHVVLERLARQVGEWVLDPVKVMLVASKHLSEYMEAYSASRLALRSTCKIRRE